MGTLQMTSDESGKSSQVTVLEQSEAKSDSEGGDFVE